MLTGTLSINSIDDSQLVKLLKVKIEHEGSLVFNPNQLQVASQPQPQQPHRPGMPQPPQQQRKEQTYNNAVIQWHSEDGLKAVKQLLHELTEQQHEAK